MLQHWDALCMLCYSHDLTLAMPLDFSRYQKNHGEEHWKQIKYVLYYVRGTLIILYVLMVTTFGYRVILMLIGKGILMNGDLHLVIYSHWQEVLFLGAASYNNQLLFHPWKPDILLHWKQQRKVYG
jgi:hypothetical protein